jgi:hypothetical protein
VDARPPVAPLRTLIDHVLLEDRIPPLFRNCRLLQEIIQRLYRQIDGDAPALPGVCRGSLNPVTLPPRMSF